jgi:hypothetical protein
MLNATALLLLLTGASPDPGHVEARDEPTRVEADGAEEGGEDGDIPGVVRLTLSSGTDGRFGGSIGNVLAVPFAVPGPGATQTLRADLTAFIFFGAIDVSATLGLRDDQGDAPLVGYGAMLRSGLRFDFQVLRLQAEVHGGISSLALFPLPRAGVGFAASLYPVRTRSYQIDITPSLDLDALLIAPAPSAELSAGARYILSGCGQSIWLEARAGVQGSAVIAVLANTLSGAVFIGAHIGVTFD